MDFRKRKVENGLEWVNQNSFCQQPFCSATFLGNGCSIKYRLERRGVKKAF